MAGRPALRGHSDPFDNLGISRGHIIPNYISYVYLLQSLLWFSFHRLFTAFSYMVSQRSSSACFCNSSQLLNPLRTNVDIRMFALLPLRPVLTLLDD